MRKLAALAVCLAAATAATTAFQRSSSGRLQCVRELTAFNPACRSPAAGQQMDVQLVHTSRPRAAGK